MEDQMHYIDNFFQGLLSPEETKSFEDRIINDPAFAADVAFYVSSRHVAKQMIEQEKKARYKELYASSNGHQKEQKTGKVRKMWYVVGASAAAAAVTAVTVGVYWLNTPSIQEVAQKYVDKNYHDLPVKMGTADQYTKGVEFYNKHQYTQALSSFENAFGKDSPYKVLQYAGVSALKSSDYNKALRYFHQMENYTSQFSNPAVLLQAVTYMERNKPGDKEQAKELLDRVINNNLEGKEQADDWIKKFN